MTSERTLLCTFNINNELIDHTWHIRQTFEDNDSKIHNCLDQGMWPCCEEGELVFGTFDFRTLFVLAKEKYSNTVWQFYKGIIPYTRTYSTVNVEYLVLNLSDYSFQFEKDFDIQMRLESIYQKFLEKIEDSYFRHQQKRFMKQQERMLTQVATILSNPR